MHKNSQKITTDEDERRERGSGRKKLTTANQGTTATEGFFSALRLLVDALVPHRARSGAVLLLCTRFVSPPVLSSTSEQDCRAWGLSNPKRAIRRALRVDVKIFDARAIIAWCRAPPPRPRNLLRCPAPTHPPSQARRYCRLSCPLPGVC